MAIKSQSELYQVFTDELKAQAPSLTDFNAGSNNDIMGGITSTALEEIEQFLQDEFRKTFFSTADGPEITGGPDDLQTLAVDHFGDDFARPGAIKSRGIVTFARPNADKGNVTIEAGTVVKTQKDSGGNSISFITESDVVMIGNSINASVVAAVEGPSGNVNPGVVSVIETALTDSSITVLNGFSFAGGKDAETDAEYRQTILLLLQTLKGATISAIESKAKNVPGIVFAKGIEFLQFVIEWNPATSEPVGNYFSIVRAKLYIADANGNASGTLIQQVADAIKFIRACGVRVDIVAADPITINWTGVYALNPAGPNYDELVEDGQRVRDVMLSYLQSLLIGTSFSRSDANAYMMAQFGPAGSNDLTSFNTTIPAADVTLTENQKVLPGVIA